MRYIKTILVSSLESLTNVKAGQWIKTETGARGQYLGTTSKGVAVIRWQTLNKFATVDALANKPMRQFAKVYGAR